MKIKTNYLKGLLLFTCILIYSLLLAQSQRIDWANTHGPNSITSFSEVDDKGNVYSFGVFNDSVDFDPGPGLYTLAPDSSMDIYLQKVDKNGNFIWAKNISNNASVMPHLQSIAIDSIGNIYLAGNFRGSMDFDPGPGIQNLSTTVLGQTDIFILKLNSSGNFVWVKQIGNSGFHAVYTVIINNSGDLIINGIFNGTVDFDPNAGIQNFTAQGPGPNQFILKLDVNGNYIWANQIGCTSVSNPTNMEVDNNDDIILSGRFSDTLIIDTGSLATKLYADTSINSYIVKLNSLGNFIWSKQINGAAPLAINTDANNNVIVIGRFEDIVDFDPSLATNFKDANMGEQYILKLDPNGNFNWVKQLPAIDVRLLGSDDSSHVYVLGSFADTLDINPNSGVNNLVTIGGQLHKFLLKLNSNGTYNWAGQIGSNWPVNFESLTIDTEYNIYLSGRCFDSINFSWDTTAHNLVPTITSDAFTLKISQYISLCPRLLKLNNDIFHFGTNSVNWSYSIPMTKNDTVSLIDTIYAGSPVSGNASSLILNDSNILYSNLAPFHGIDSFFYAIQDTNGCLDSAWVIIHIDSINQCAGCVWPGDANDDLVANNFDLLEIGLGFGELGMYRPIQGNTWQEHAAYNWQKSNSIGVNYKHVDCNGDGIINFDDTTAISLNYGLTHSKSGGLNGGPNDPNLSFMPTVDSSNTGTAINIPIILGNMSIPANNVYGIAFTITYDNAVVDTNSASIDFSSSWMVSPSNLVEVQKDFWSSGEIDAGVSRINHSNISGFGQIGEFRIVTIENLAGKTAFDIVKELQLGFKDVRLIDNQGNIIPVNLIGDTLYITKIENEFNLLNNVSIYPNPAQNQLNILTNNIDISELKLLSMDERLIESYSNITNQLTINLRSYSNGIYFIQMSNSVGIETKKIVISR